MVIRVDMAGMIVRSGGARKDAGHPGDGEGRTYLRNEAHALPLGRLRPADAHQRGVQC